MMRSQYRWRRDEPRRPVFHIDWALLTEKSSKNRTNGGARTPIDKKRSGQEAVRKGHGAMESLGIIGFDSFHFAVENLERSRSFYREKLDFDEVARAGNLLTQRSGQVSAVFGAGDVRVCVSTPLHQDCRAARYLRRHP